MKRIMFYQFGVALICLTTLASSLSAAVSVTSTKDIAPAGGAVHDVYVPGAGFVPSNSDLAEGLTAIHDADDVIELSGGAATWTDGSVATVYGEPTSAGDAVDHAGYGTVGNNNMLTFDLGSWYDLSKVDVYAAWNDSGRDNFSFDLLVSDDDAAYTSLASYTKDPDNDTGTDTTPVTNLHSIADDGGAPYFASGVRYVRLQTTSADNNYAGLAEIDVFGTATIPEPTSIALALVGCATMLLRRRA